VIAGSRGEARLWLAQRATAAVLAIGVAVHLTTMIFAVQGGLSAAEILSRTRHNVIWASFYGVFVLAVAIHAPIGLRTIVGEWLGWRGRSADAACFVVALALLVSGWRAVYAVTA